MGWLNGYLVLVGGISILAATILLGVAVVQMRLNSQWGCYHISGAIIMQITKETRVSDILEHYGDIAEVMEVFGIKRVGRYSLRLLAARALTVEWAARIHRVPLDEFLQILQQAVVTRHESSEDDER